jgi:predicted DNA-binding transcriptional regulator AlpA
MEVTMKKIIEKKWAEPPRPKGYAGDRLLRTRDVLEILRISRHLLPELILRGDLIPVKLGEKATRFFEKDVLAYMEQLRNGQPKITVGNVDYTEEEVNILNNLCGEFCGTGE